ncbi:hypothetical protein C1646_665738 [Rhizophagus diaphanus]|nr:hypothetical protein C1646_665738 [Rhizophagus diaphanus] [Rhizophagus sp. MUCL 43196]
MTNKNMKVTRKTKTRKGKSQQFPNSLKSTKNNNASHTQDTNIRRSQQGQDELNSSNNTSVTNAFNLTFIGHNTNGLGSDSFKLNIFMDYCTNKGADIVDKKYSKIDLDRIRITADTQEEILLNSKDEVQAEAINTFSSLFRARNHKFENLPE